MKRNEIEKLILDNELNLADVLDIIIRLNGIIGVGLITLADQVSEHIKNYCTGNPYEKTSKN